MSEDFRPLWRTVQVSLRKSEMVTKPAAKPKSLLKARLLSPFLERYRVRYAMLREPAVVQGVFNNCIMTGDRKLLFTRNPKAGCTSVSQLLVHYSTGSFSNAVHKQEEGVFQLNSGIPHFRAGFDRSDTFCFSIVRNPLERLLSGFFNFFVDGEHQEAPQYIPALKDRGFVEGGDIHRNLNAFVDIVEESLSQNPLGCEPHWREQHVNIGHGFLPYDYIAKLENYSEDIRHVFESVSLGEYLDSIDWKKKRNRSSRYDLPLPAKLVSRIEQIYAKDYELFGY